MATSTKAVMIPMEMSGGGGSRAPAEWPPGRQGECAAPGPYAHRAYRMRGSITA